MSKETMKLMNELRTINTNKIVKNTLLIEDQETYPKAIRALMNRYKDILLQNKELKASDKFKKIQEVDKPFVNYIRKMPLDEIRFAKKVVEESTKESISAELDIARNCVLERRPYIDQEERGLEYNLKNNRIKSYIKHYDKQLSKGNMIYYSQEQKQQEVERIFSNITKGTNTNYKSIQEREALFIAAKYLATLSDKEFMQLLQKTNQITEEQAKSLTRKYRDISKLEAHKHKKFDIMDKDMKALSEALAGQTK